MTRTVWWCVLGILSIGIVAIDIGTPSFIDFQIMFLFPVGLSAWYLSRGAGIVFAVVIVGSRFAIGQLLQHDEIRIWAAAVNGGIRMLVLIGLAVLVAATHDKRTMARRVQILEGLLPICMFCKKIRQNDGTWQQIESYVSERSAAEFTHGICATCRQEHYGKHLRSPDPNDTEPGIALDRRGT